MLRLRGLFGLMAALAVLAVLANGLSPGQLHLFEQRFEQWAKNFDRQLAIEIQKGSTPAGSSVTTTTTPAQAPAPCPGATGTGHVVSSTVNANELVLSVVPAAGSTSSSTPTSWCAIAEVLDSNGGPAAGLSGEFALSTPAGTGSDILATTNAEGTASTTFSASSETEVQFSAGELQAAVVLSPISWSATSVPVGVGTISGSSAWAEFSTWAQSSPPNQLECFSHAALSVTETAGCTASPTGWGPMTAPSTTTAVACSAFHDAQLAAGAASCAVTATLVGCAVPESGVGAAACVFGLTDASWAVTGCVGAVLGAVGDLLSGTQSGGNVATHLTATLTATSPTDAVVNGAETAVDMSCGTAQRSYTLTKIPKPGPSQGSVTLTLEVTDGLGDPVPNAVAFLSFDAGAGGSAAVGSVVLGPGPTGVVTNPDGEVKVTYSYPPGLPFGGSDTLNVSATEGGAQVASASYTPVSTQKCPRYEPPYHSISCGAVQVG
ncbi:MAG: hypothetical protein M0005_17220 [Actinomycetota bacterium]|jgi:hypothetical protein|nr:hypothetical protein [Actinomycetota bacterium]